MAFLDSPVLQGDRLRALWRLALATGLRRGELVALRWSDIDEDGARLFVRQAAGLEYHVAEILGFDCLRAQELDAGRQVAVELDLDG